MRKKKKTQRGKVDDKKEEEDEKPKLSRQGRSGNEEKKRWRGKN